MCKKKVVGMVTTSLGASHFMSLDTNIITVIDLLNTVRINKNQPKKSKMISKIRQGNQRMEMSNDCLWRSRCRHWIESSHFSIKKFAQTHFYYAIWWCRNSIATIGSCTSFIQDLWNYHPSVILWRYSKFNDSTSFTLKFAR